jgi:hypothetical protein
VHASAAASRTPGLASEEFRHEFNRWHPLCQGVSMSTVSTKDDVFVFQVRTDGCRDGFFANVSMAGAVDETPLMATCEFFFRLPNRLHRPVQAK